MRNQRFIGWRHRIVPQLIRPHPFEALLLSRLDKAFPAPADIKGHEQMEVGIRMARECERRETLRFDCDPQFLPQLPDQTLLRLLAGFDLAAGKLPEPRHRLSFWAPCDEHASIRIDEGASGNQNKPDGHAPASA